MQKSLTYPILILDTKFFLASEEKRFYKHSESRAHIVCIVFTFKYVVSEPVSASYTWYVHQIISLCCGDLCF